MFYCWFSFRDFSNIVPARAYPLSFRPSNLPTPVDNTAMLYGILAAVVVAILIGLAALLGVFRKK